MPSDGHHGNRRRNNRSGQTQSPGRHDNKPVITEDSSPILKEFLTYQHELDEKHDRYERLVKISRDITIESKRAIFVLQRVSGNTERDRKSLAEAEQKFAVIHKDKFYPLAVELIGQDPHQYVRAFSPGVQEYIEAVSFHHYLTHGDLITREQIMKNLTFQHKTQENDDGSTTIAVHITPMDYVLGLADLTGELMRVGINSVGAGDFEKPFEICKFLQKIHDAFVALGNAHRELPRKLNVLRSSLHKVEQVCYTIQIRGSEFPKHLLADMLKNSGKAIPNSDSIGDGIGYADG